MQERRGSHAARAGENSSSQNHNIPVVSPKLLHFWAIWEVPAGLSLIAEPRVVSTTRKGRAQGMSSRDAESVQKEKQKPHLRVLQCPKLI